VHGLVQKVLDGSYEKMTVVKSFKKSRIGAAQKMFLAMPLMTQKVMHS
jgi:hypothetical protein